MKEARTRAILKSMIMKRFENGLHVRVTSEEHPLKGKTGRVARLMISDNGAWVKMDERPEALENIFPFHKNDSRSNHVSLYPEQCEKV